MSTLDITAAPENLPRVLAFIHGLLPEGCGSGVQMQIDMAAEEIFVNISRYAYQPETGPVQIQAEFSGQPPCVTIRFLDRGQPYNPLEKPDPPLNIPLKERKKGGLGIFMVKKTMDSIAYEYRDGQNILTISKSIA